MVNFLQIGADKRGNIKSIPISEFTADSWRSAFGAGADTSNVIALYESVPWLYQGVERRAMALASMPLEWHRGGKESEDQPALPFKFDAYSLLNQIEAHLVLYGRAYLQKSTNGYRRVKALRALHPSTIREQFNAKDGTLTLERTLDGKTAKLSEDEFVRIALPVRKTELGYGQSPAGVALMAAGVLNAGNQLQALLYQNGIISPTVITVEGNPQADEVKRIESWVNRAASGLKNAFKTLALSKAINIQQLGLVDVDKMAMPELTKQRREDVAAALGVPQTLIFSDAANFATAQQDWLNFYDMTVVPEARLIETALNEQLFAAFAWEIKLNEQKLEIYQKLTAESVLARVKEMFAMGIITKDEAREELGMEPMTPEQVEQLRPAPVVVQQQPAPAPAAAQAEPTPKAALKSETDDARKFETFALKRWQEGKLEKLDDFESDVFDESALAYVKRALLGATSRSAAKRAIAGAIEWAGYP